MGSWNFSHIGIDVKNDEMRTLAEQLMECIYWEEFDNAGSEAGCVMMYVDDYDIKRNCHGEMDSDNLFALANVLFGDTDVGYEEDRGSNTTDSYYRLEYQYDADSMTMSIAERDYSYGSCTAFGKRYEGDDLERAGEKQWDDQFIKTAFPDNAIDRLIETAENRGYTELADLMRQKCGNGESEAVAIFMQKCDAGKEKIYQEALSLKENGEFEKAIELFAKCESCSYKDSEQQLKGCKDTVENMKLQQAQKLIEKGKYEEAIEILEALDYIYFHMNELCEEGIFNRDYPKALNLISEGQCEDALILLQKMEGFKCAEDKVEEPIKVCERAINEKKYQEAMKLVIAKDYAGAASILVNLAGYDNVEKIISEDRDLMKAVHDEKMRAFSTVGSHVFFGRFSQTRSGDDVTPVEWVVLDYNKERNEALLISLYGLTGMWCIEEFFSKFSWETNDIRYWLNEDFLDATFNADECNAIKTALVTADDNPEYDTDPGDDTEDKLFLLSIDEARDYFKDDDARMCKPTPFAMKHIPLETDHGENILSGRPHCWWWLRTPGVAEEWAAFVKSTGSINNFGSDGDNVDCCAVRPAMWVKLDLIP